MIPVTVTSLSAALRRAARWCHRRLLPPSVEIICFCVEDFHTSGYYMVRPVGWNLTADWRFEPLKARYSIVISVTAGAVKRSCQWIRKRNVIIHSRRNLILLPAPLKSSYSGAEIFLVFPSKSSVIPAICGTWWIYRWHNIWIIWRFKLLMNPGKPEMLFVSFTRCIFPGWNVWYISIIKISQNTSVPFTNKSLKSYMSARQLGEFPAAVVKSVYPLNHLFVRELKKMLFVYLLFPTAVL